MHFFYQKRNCFFFSLREMSFIIILESFCRYTAHTHIQTYGDRVVPITTMVCENWQRERNRTERNVELNWLDRVGTAALLSILPTATTRRRTISSRDLRSFFRADHKRTFQKNYMEMEHIHEQNICVYVCVDAGRFIVVVVVRPAVLLYTFML